MGLFELFVAILLCLVLVIIVATLFIALSGNTEVGGRIRQHLMERVKELPFYRMLQRRKIDPDHFFRETPVAQLEKETKSCETCPNLRQCEETLSQPEEAKADYSFCPNDPAISEMETKQPSSE
jgi:hypothetical protein